MRNVHLFNNPMCVRCASKGYMKAADMVDHIVEVRDNQDLMLDRDNLQSLCNSCHRFKTEAEKKKRKGIIVEANHSPSITVEDLY